MNNLTVYEVAVIHEENDVCCLYESYDYNEALKEYKVYCSCPDGGEMILLKKTYTLSSTTPLHRESMNEGDTK